MSETTEKKALNNYQYCRGNISRMDEMENGRINFDVAVNNGKDAKGNDRLPTYISCTLSGKKAVDFKEKGFDKGSFIQVSGEYHIATNTDQKTNKTHINNTLYVNNANYVQVERDGNAVEIKGDVKLEKGDKLANLWRKNNNVVELKANVGVDADFLQGSGGKKDVAKSFVINTVNYKDKDGNYQSRENALEVIAFGDKASNLKDVKKGEPLILSGSLMNRVYKDNEGFNRYTSSVVVNKVEKNLEVIKNREEAKKADAEKEVEPKQTKAAKKKPAMTK